MILCDSIIESNFDAKGNETVVTRWACDSVSRFKDINMIKFFESWYINDKTNLLEKEMLGYGVYLLDSKWKLYRPLFFIFKDSLSVEKAKKKISFNN